MPEAGVLLSPFETWLHQILRVPGAPETPEGSPGSIRVFRAGRNFYKLCLVGWAFSQVFFLGTLIFVIFVFGRVQNRWPEWLREAWTVGQALLAAGFVALAVISLVSQRLNYALRWYIVTDRSLRIRAGIFSLQEITMTFSNIQEIRVTAGPLQTLLGIADVEVQSAGGGSVAKGHVANNVAHFAGVSNANEIRDLMVERLRQYRDSGLGGDHVPAVALSQNDAALEAAAGLLDEARALRAAFSANPRS